MSALPSFIEPLFWDCRRGSVTWDSHRDSVIERVLGEGDLEAMRWIRREVGDAALGSWIREHRGRRLSPRRIRYWQVILELPEIEVAEWLKDPARAIWDRRTA